MRRIEHFEVPHLALFKSAVSRVLADELGESASNAVSIDTDHPLMLGTDRYCHAMEGNQTIPEPDSDREDDPEVQAYLAALSHRRAHARIADDASLEADLARQTARFKYGNPLWQRMWIQYYDYYWQYPWHLGCQPKYRSWQDATGGHGDINYAVIEWKLPANGRVAIVGDIGTGTDEAAAVLLAALSLNPDAILHLGDVYFSGTSYETRHRLVGMIREVMRGTKRRVPFFTVPGNHEYFTGCISLLNALDSDSLIDLPDQRQRASYFCLRSRDDGWQFLGLDSGYYGHYMNVIAGAKQATLEKLHIGKVALPVDQTNPHWPKDHNPYFAAGGNLPQKDTTANVEQVTVRTDEATWHADKLQTFPGRSILLSHHQLYSALDVCGVTQRQLTGTDGKSAADPTDFNRLWINTGLWRQFGPAFGDKIAAWMWGHEHNLNIFENNYRPADWPTGTPEATQIFKTLPKGRCAGASAIPVQQSEAPYAVKYPVTQEPPSVTLGLTDGWYNHAFQLFEMAGRGNAGQMRYYQVAGADPTPILMFQEAII
jgi:3',5'-cyclic AMP phosphodiesterase CpdA